MEEILRKIEALYEAPGEDVIQAAPPEDREELTELLRIKQMLDARRRRRPSAEIVDAVARAASVRRGVKVAADRPVRGPRRLQSWRWAGMLSVLLAVVVTAVLVRVPPEASDAPGPHAVLPEALPPPAQESPAVAMDAGRDHAPAGEEKLALGPFDAQSKPSFAEQRPAHTTARSDAEEAADVHESSLEDLAWDHSDDVRELYRRVDQLSAVSASSASWHASSPRTLAAPVGLKRSPSSSNDHPQLRYIPTSQ